MKEIKESRKTTRMVSQDISLNASCRHNALISESKEKIHSLMHHMTYFCDKLSY